MKKILILTRADLSKYSRAIKQIQYLKENFHITTVGLKPHGFENKFIKYEKQSFYKRILRLPLLKFGQFNKYFWDKSNKLLLKKLQHNVFDLIIAHSYKTLPLAFKLAKNKTKIIFDEHEFAPEEYAQNFFWKYFFQKYIVYTLQKYVPKVSSIITVSEGIANRYKKDFNVLPTVITNAVNYKDVKLSEVSNDIKIIYHGVASPGRNIELNIEVINYLPENYTLDLMLVKAEGFSDYFNKIKNITSNNSRVNIIPPVRFEQIEIFCNKYDIGLFLLPPRNFSLKNALPNKFFQYIQSRLLIAIGPSPAMAKIVKENDIGVIADDFIPKALAKKIEKLSISEITTKKNNTDSVAFKYSFENEFKKFENLLIELNILD